MKTFFLDTNVFEQCRDLKDLPWGEVAEGHDVLLIISRPLQDEIDKHKSDRNERRAGRARLANSFFRQLINDAGGRIVLQDAGPRVEVARQAPAKYESSPCVHLDLERNDDRIIAEALVYRDAHPDESVALLSHDTGPLGMATDCGLAIQMVPGSWLLPPQPDPRDQQIAELKKKLAERAIPEITVEIKREGASSSRLVIVVDRYRRLSPEQIDELVNLAVRRYPLKSNFDSVRQHPGGIHSAYLSFMGEYRAPSDEEIHAYQEKYRSWLNMLREFFADLPSMLALPSRHAALYVSIDNIGSVPAEDLTIEFEVVGGLLFPTKQVEAVKPALPLPPEAPQGRYVELGGLSMLADWSRHNPMLELTRTPTLPDFASMIPQRDKHEFYCQKNDVQSTSLVCECDEFRHKRGPTSLPLWLFVPPEFERENALLTCRVTAKNLPDPVTAQLPCKVEYRGGDAFAISKTLVEPEMTIDLRFVLPNSKKNE